MSTGPSMSAPPARKPLFISLSLKLLVGFTLLFSVVFAAAFYWFYTFATERALARIAEDLTDTLNAAAQGIDGEELAALYQDNLLTATEAAYAAYQDCYAKIASEAEQYADLVCNRLKVNGAGFSDDDRYRREMDWLETVHRIEPRAWPYTYVRGDNEDDIVFLSDLWARYDASKATKFGQAYISGGTLTNSLKETRFKLEPYRDQWGYWVSAYTPVKNAQGELVGGIGMDFSADYVLQVQQAIKDQVAVAFGITYVTLFVLVFVISGVFTRPIVALTHAAERIGEGDYEQDLTKYSGAGGFSRDEIGTLAEVFTIMVNKVHQREQALRRQVEELKIEVDDAKRQKQVSEIVDSGFFQELQDKARQMRERRRGGSGAGGEAPKA